MTERVANVTVVKNIVVSTLSFLHQARVGDKGSDLFRWTVRLEAAENLIQGEQVENLSNYVKSVEFVLHQTFTQPRRLVEQPPFEVTEIGWGEFELVVRINFQDTQERPVELKHQLRLRADPEQDAELYDRIQKYFRGEIPAHPQLTEPVIRHTCDQLVFSAPHEWFYEKLKVEADAADPDALRQATQQEQLEFENLVKIQNMLRSHLALGVEDLLAADWEVRRDKEKDNHSRSLCCVTLLSMVTVYTENAGNTNTNKHILDIRLLHHEALLYTLTVRIPVSTIFFSAELVDCRDALDAFIAAQPWFAGCEDISDDIYEIEKIHKSTFQVLQFGCCEVLKHAEFGTHCLVRLLRTTRDIHL